MKIWISIYQFLYKINSVVEAKQKLRELKNRIKELEIASKKQGYRDLNTLVKYFKISWTNSSIVISWLILLINSN